ncbi:GGDEF domain-containing protein [Candidatus Woesearchaeota archaeon]|nr:GGDEF domain-containing protein [Candidatus Woesearchaeota archaeon]
MQHVYESVEKIINEHVNSMRSFLISRNLANDVLFCNIKELNTLPQHLVAVPLVSKNTVLGFIACYANESMASKLELLSWLCAHLVVVFEREKHHDEVRQSAVHDALTGLHNRVFLEIVGEQSIAKLCAAKFPCSLLLFDIDNFKLYNDKNGHVAGDKILQDLGTLLLSFCDKNIIVSRYGGEEFVVLLPEAKNDNALEVAEKLRASVAEHVGITISVGVVSCLNSSVSLQKMVQEADIALYKAKSLGKNCCVQRIIVDKNVNVIDAYDANSIGKT